MRVPIQVDNEGRIILGMLYISPSRKKSSPVVILNYGLNGDRVDNHRLAVLFATKANEQGITVVTYDYSGCGVSSNEFWETSLTTKSDDAAMVIDFVKSCFSEEKPDLILLGYSDGIRVIDTLLKRREDISAICAWNPIFKSMTTTFKSSDKKITIEPSTKKLVFPVFGVYMGMDYLKEANQDTTVDDILNHALPKLMVFGTGDIHTLEFQKEFKTKRNAGSNFDLYEIENANHLFNRLSWSEELVDKTIGWVNNYVLAKS